MADEESSTKRRLREVLHRDFESKDLDYNGPCVWDEANKASCCAIVKDILAMANTLGGYVVIGVSESNDRFNWEGLTPVQVQSFETTRINRFLQNYADPPVNTRLIRLDDNGRWFVIIEVPRFPDTPHICQRDYPGALAAGALYVRTDSNESAPVRASADFRIVLEQAVRNRSDALIETMRSVLAGRVSENVSPDVEFENQRQLSRSRYAEADPYPQSGYTGYRETSFRPGRFEADRFSLEQLRIAAHRGHVDFRGWPFLFISERRQDVTYTFQDGLESLIAFVDFGQNERADFWRFYQSGFFFHRTLMREESAQHRTGGKPLIDVWETVVHATEAIVAMTRLYDGLLEDVDVVTLDLRILGASGRRLTSEETFSSVLFGECIARIPGVGVTRTLSLAEWRAGIVDHAVEISKQVFLRFNWDSPDVAQAARIAKNLLERRL